MSDPEKHRRGWVQEIEALRAELADRETRLAEAEETLRAIREGDVDAVVVSTPEAPRIFTLESADQTYRTIVEEMREGAVTLVEDGYVSYSNRRFAEMIKLPLEQTIGSRFRDFVTVSDSGRFDRLVRRALTQSARSELALNAADGSVVPVHVSLNLAMLDQLPSVCMVVTDLTEQKQVEQIRASEQHYRLLFDRNPDGVFAVDPSGRFVLANPACELISGYSAEELQTMSFADLAVPELLRKAIAGFERSLREPGYFQLETELTRKDGRRVDLWVAGEPIVSDGRMVAIHCTAKDITERKRAEEELRRAKEVAEEASRVKGQFLANISHELRTPMNAILGMIDLALPKAVEPVVTDCLQTARDSADLLLTLLNDLLDTSKIEAGKLELESAPFSLRRVMDQVSRVLSVRASEKGLHFSCRVSTQTPDALVGDRTRLEQVLINLAGNAIKFTQRGEVEVAVKGAGIRDCGLEGSNQPPTSGQQHPIHGSQSQILSARLEFCVHDTGIGISPSDLEHIFEPFSQGDASTTRRFGGTGLGLSISQTLVDMMGGSVQVESEIGRGSTFRFTIVLPLAAEAPVEAEPSLDLSSPPPCKLRVLLVEDNPANQKLATYVLRDRGHRIHTAEDGCEAIRLTAENRYDVILMDVQMPGMDGLEATAAIRKRDRGGRRVPIIAMTAHAMKGDRQRCLAAGMDGYLSKPVNAQELIGLVERLARDSSPGGQIADEMPGPTDTPPATSAAVFDPDAAVARCFKNHDMLREMVQFFFRDMEDVFPQIQAALEKGDLSEVARLGHRLRGTISFLGAAPAAEAARQLEQLCQSGNGQPSDAKEAVNALARECMLLCATLRRHPLAAGAAQERVS